MFRTKKGPEAMPSEPFSTFFQKIFCDFAPSGEKTEKTPSKALPKRLPKFPDEKFSQKTPGHFRTRPGNELLPARFRHPGGYANQPCPGSCLFSSPQVGSHSLRPLSGQYSS